MVYFRMDKCMETDIFIKNIDIVIDGLCKKESLPDRRFYYKVETGPRWQEGYRLKESPEKEYNNTIKKYTIEVHENNELSYLATFDTNEVGSLLSSCVNVHFFMSQYFEGTRYSSYRVEYKEEDFNSPFFLTRYKSLIDLVTKILRAGVYGLPKEKAPDGTKQDSSQPDSKTVSSELDKSVVIY